MIVVIRVMFVLVRFVLPLLPIVHLVNAVHRVAGAHLSAPAVEIHHHRIVEDQKRIVLLLVIVGRAVINAREMNAKNGLIIK